MSFVYSYLFYSHSDTENNFVNLAQDLFCNFGSKNFESSSSTFTGLYF